jgi:hypothetical protein
MDKKEVTGTTHMDNLLGLSKTFVNLMTNTIFERLRYKASPSHYLILVFILIKKLYIFYFTYLFLA